MFVHDPHRVVSGMAAGLQIDPSAIVYRLAAKPDNMGVSYGAVSALVHPSNSGLPMTVWAGPLGNARHDLDPDRPEWVSTAATEIGGNARLPA